MFWKGFEKKAVSLGWLSKHQLTGGFNRGMRAGMAGVPMDEAKAMSAFHRQLEAVKKLPVQEKMKLQHHDLHYKDLHPDTRKMIRENVKETKALVPKVK